MSRGGVPPDETLPIRLGRPWAILKIEMVLLSPRFDVYRKLPPGCSVISAALRLPVKSCRSVDVSASRVSEPRRASQRNVMRLAVSSVRT
jgi:hypothetical protein